jgi:hypothetical protein
MSDQLVAEADAYSTHNRQTSVTSEEFEPAIPAIKRAHTCGLYRTATDTGKDEFLVDLLF